MRLGLVGPGLKAKMVLEAVRGTAHAARACARRYGGVQTSQAEGTQFLGRGSRVFESESEPSGGSVRERELLHQIGELTVERDFCARAQCGQFEQAAIERLAEQRGVEARWQLIELKSRYRRTSSIRSAM